MPGAVWVVPTGEVDALAVDVLALLADLAHLLDVGRDGVESVARAAVIAAYFDLLGRQGLKCHE